MKILATFDGSEFSESILPMLTRVAALPDPEFLLLRIGTEPRGSRRRGSRRLPLVGGSTLGQSDTMVFSAGEPKFTENLEQAVERRLAELREYLEDVGARLPHGTKVRLEAHLADDAAPQIVECARREKPDVIVMATHSRHGIGALFGSTTEQVVRSGVAPVLLVHPEKK
jgi:nucleotide-binding universal stress UspA family protein